MPPRNRNNQLPPAVEPPLPALDPGEDSVPLDDMGTMNGVSAMDYGYGAPEDVVNDLPAEPEVRRAEPNLQQVGATMDISFIQQLNNAATDEEFNAMYDALDPALQRVYDRSYGMEVNPLWAANEVQKFYEEQDKTRIRQEDPLNKQQLADRKARMAERAAVQNDFKIRRQNTLSTIEDILNDPDYKNLVGPFDGTIGGMYDAAFSPEMQTKRARLDRLVNFDVLDLTKYLRPISQDELKYLRTLVPGQTQHWEVYEQYLKEKRDMLKAAEKAVVNPATNQALPGDDDEAAPASAPTAGASAPAPSRNTFVYDGATYERMPDGTARLIE